MKTRDRRIATYQTRSGECVFQLMEDDEVLDTVRCWRGFDGSWENYSWRFPSRADFLTHLRALWHVPLHPDQESKV